MKSAGVINPTQISFLDHLAPLCVLMDVPFVTWDDAMADVAARFYPGLRVERIAEEDATLDYFYRHYQVLYTADPRVRLDKALSGALPEGVRSPRVVHHPHGFSDKVGWFRWHYPQEDVAVIYGDNMRDMLADGGIPLPTDGRIVTAGNLRHSYYLEHQRFFDDLTTELALPRLRREGRTFLYAPTWTDWEGNSSFFHACELLIDKLPRGNNLIVKLHPEMYRRSPEESDAILARHEQRDDVAFVRSFPLVFPFLSRADVFIGDASSIAYDYLAFDRPLFFLDQRKHDPGDRAAYRYRFGKAIPPEEYASVYDIVEETLAAGDPYAAARAEVTAYTFATVSSASVRDALTAALAVPAPELVPVGMLPLPPK